MLLPRPRLAVRRTLLSPSTFQRKSSYASLSRHELRVSSPTTRLVLHPGAFLLHLGAITLGSMFVPTISANRSTQRHSSSTTSFLSNSIYSAVPVPTTEDGAALTVNAEKAQEADEATPTTSEPIPSPRQLASLASLVYTQVLESPRSAAFNLRQLHLLRKPTLDVPARDVVVPETWIWADPATAVVQAFLETEEPGREKLEPLVIQIAQNAVRWDQLVAAKVCERDGVDATELLESLGRGDGVRSSGLQEEPRHVGPHPDVDAQRPTRDTPPPLGISLTTPAPPNPLSSIPLETLQSLILFLLNNSKSSVAESDERTTTALALAYSLDSTPSLLSHHPSILTDQVYRRSITVALRHSRVDLAARSWARWFALSSHPSFLGQPPGTRVYEMLGKRIAPHRGAIALNEHALRPEVCAALDTLTGVLEREWDAHGYSAASAFIIRLLLKIPKPVDATAHLSESQWPILHTRVYARSRRVLLRVVGDLVGRDLTLAAYLSNPRDVRIVIRRNRRQTVTQQALKEATSVDKARGFTTEGFNSLMAHSIAHFDSPRLAFLLYETLLDAGLRPTPPTLNVLTPLLPNADAILQRLDSHGENDRTLPLLLSSLTGPDLALLNRLVFSIIPELDSTSSAPLVPAPLQSLSHYATPKSTRPPPAPGRSPYLYVAMLHALADAGRTGLAERVFRLARWAAERSRLPDSTESPWVLPPHAFTIMLSVYATEARRGKAYASTLDDRRWVRGWARNAIRVAAREKRNAALSSSLGGVVRGNRSQEGDRMPNVLRPYAAQVAVKWDLAQGSQPAELESFAKAIGSPYLVDSTSVMS
ncbi:hypothetical protein RQP46_005395 [Phenoliferia psychrophenolica]